MLASQESVLRSQPSEADYRAATVKQRPTSRRITPAEISVSATYTPHTGRGHEFLGYHILTLKSAADFIAFFVLLCCGFEGFSN